MCLPALLASAAGSTLAAGGAFMSTAQFALSSAAIIGQHLGASQQGKAIHKAKLAKAEADKKIATKTFMQNIKSSQLALQAGKVRAAQDLQAANRKSLKAMATAKVGGAAAGVGGGTTTADIGMDYAQRQMEFATNRLESLSYEQANFLLQTEQASAQTEAAFARATFDPIAMPSAMNAFVNIIAAGAQAATDWRDPNALTPSSKPLGG